MTAKRCVALLVAVLLVLVACSNEPADSDGDGLSNSEEQALGSDPDKADTDDDGVDDSQEDADGTDATRADSDDDGATDSEEHEAGTDPIDPTSTPESDEPTAEEPEEPDVCSEEATAPCLAGVNAAATRTCHNFDDAGGLSDGRIFGQVFGVSAVGNLVLVLRVTEAAEGSPETRNAQATYNATGQFVARVALFAPGEVLDLVGVDFGQGPVRPDSLPDFTYTVLPLDDPATVCDPL